MTDSGFAAKQIYLLGEVRQPGLVKFVGGEPCMNPGDLADNSENCSNIFMANFGNSFGSMSFGNVAQTGLSEDFVAGDLTVVGSLAGGGDLGNVDLIYVPEPTSLVLLLLAAFALLARRRVPM